MNQNTSTPSNQTSNQANAYLKTRVMSASPEELRLLLLEGALKFARQGLEGIKRLDHEATYSGISQCRNIIFELMTSIRNEIDPELASKVRALYNFMYSLSIEAAHEKDATKVEKLIELLDYERETWVLLMNRLASEKSAATATATAKPASDAPRSPLSVSA
jgi:flagellar protein FliS